MTDERYPDVEGLVEKLNALDAFTITDGAGANNALDLIDEAAAALQSLQARLSKAQGERDFYKSMSAAEADAAKYQTLLLALQSEAAALRVERDEAAAKYKHWHDVAMRAGVVVCTDGSLIYAVAESKAALRERVVELASRWIEYSNGIYGDMNRQSAINDCGEELAQLLKDNPNG